MAHDVSPSPFDGLILGLISHQWAAPVVGTPDADTAKRVFLAQQLGFLRETYLALVQVGAHVWEDMEKVPVGQSSVPFEVAVLEHPRKSRRVFLNYEAFLNVLCQMNRVLPEHFPSATDIPKFKRIRFYRNKAVEHWDAFTANVPKHGFVFQKGKAAIPVLEGIQSPLERAATLAALKTAFTALGASFGWPDDKTFNMISSDPLYCEAVFTALEAVPSALAKQSGQSPELDQVIKLLLQFGFPTPILDVEAYSADLVAHLAALT